MNQYEEFPFNAQFIEVNGHRMHYVDEGVGQTLLFVHGTPVWSYLWRKFISGLSKDYRCIAIDHIGFGKSEKPDNFAGDAQAHSHNLEAFIQKMNLTDIILVVHDFGGPIGLSNAIKNPSLFSKLIIFNTWLWETQSLKSVERINNFLNSGIGRMAYLRFNLPVNVLMKGSFKDKSLFKKNLKKVYKGVFQNAKERVGLLNIGKSLWTSSSWYQEQWENIEKISNLETMFLWGDADPFFSMEYLEKWKTKFPNAKSQVVSAGHFLQEEKPDECIDLIVQFVRQ